MRRTPTTTFITLAAASLLASTAVAQGGAGRGGGPGGGYGWGKGPGHGRGMMAQLDLSASQQDQIAALRTTMLEQTAQAREALDEKRAEMQALWNVETPDREAILAKHAEMDELRTELRVAHIDFRLAVRALLTPEQRAKVDAMPRGGRHGRHGRGGGPHWGDGWDDGVGPGPCWTDAD